MVGGAVLGECLNNAEVASVLAIGRRPLGLSHPKLSELVIRDFMDYGAVRESLRGLDACFFTLGVSSVGMDEARYTRETFDLTLAAARALLAENPGMSFCYVSGQGTDSSEGGRVMWARVKGRTENALLALPFKHAAMIRLGALEAAPGFRSKTPWIRWAYAALRPLLPLLRGMGLTILTGEQLGKAMIRAAQGRAPKPILDPKDLAALGA
jgi:uncharacterized protein YbjT (DUF2867 family)